MELLSFIGSTYYTCKLNPHSGLNSVYELLTEGVHFAHLFWQNTYHSEKKRLILLYEIIIEPGLSENRAMLSFLALYDRSSEKIEEERVNRSQSISIRD